MKKTEDTFRKDARAAFDASVDELDAATLSKLNRSRQRALEQLGRPRRLWSAWAPATGVAAAVTIAVIMVQSPVGMNGDEVPAALADMDILLGEDSIEMLEDLEFYSWLDAVELDGDVG
jgi:negative regulator of sigma E activity